MPPKIIHYSCNYAHSSGKSLLEALILASTNPKYDKKLFIELRVQYMKITSSEHVVYINCCFVLTFRISASEIDLPVSQITFKI